MHFDQFLYVSLQFTEQRTETRRTSTTGGVAREVAAETMTGRGGVGTENGEAAEIIMEIARITDTNAGTLGLMFGKLKSLGLLRAGVSVYY